MASGEKLKDLQAQLAASQAETRAAQRDVDTIKHEMARDMQVWLAMTQENVITLLTSFLEMLR